MSARARALKATRAWQENLGSRSLNTPDSVVRFQNATGLSKRYVTIRGSIVTPVHPASVSTRSRAPGAPSEVIRGSGGRSAGARNTPPPRGGDPPAPPRGGAAPPPRPPPQNGGARRPPGGVPPGSSRDS